MKDEIKEILISNYAKTKYPYLSIMTLLVILRDMEHEFPKKDLNEMYHMGEIVMAKGLNHIVIALTEHHNEFEN